MRKDIFLAVPAAGLLFFGASALVLALTDSSLAHWYVAFWVGVLCTPLGVANLLILLISEMSDPAKRKERPKVGPVLLINAGICLIVLGGVWHFSPSAFGVSASAPKFPQLEDYFAKDFNFLSLDSTISIEAKNPANGLDTTVDVKFRLFQDFSTNTEFIAVFVPFFSDNRLSQMAVPFLEHLKSEIIATRNALRERIGTGGSTRGSPMTFSKDLTFSGRVFIYTMNPFDPVQIGELVGSYRKDGLLLEIRGSDYLFIRSRH